MIVLLQYSVVYTVDYISGYIQDGASFGNIRVGTSFGNIRDGAPSGNILDGIFLLSGSVQYVLLSSRRRH